MADRIGRWCFTMEKLADFGSGGSNGCNSPIFGEADGVSEGNQGKHPPWILIFARPIREFWMKHRNVCLLGDGLGGSKQSGMLNPGTQICWKVGGGVKCRFGRSRLLPPHAHHRIRLHARNTNETRRSIKNLKNSFSTAGTTHFSQKKSIEMAFRSTVPRCSFFFRPHIRPAL